MSIWNRSRASDYWNYINYEIMRNVRKSYELRNSGRMRISAFHGIDSDGENVYVIYSGHNMLPANECRHLIVYDWDGNPAKHYLLNRNVSSVHVDGDNMWCASIYPESCVYRFEISRN